MTKESKIPDFKTEEEEAEFWDTHSITDYLDELEEVDNLVIMSVTTLKRALSVVARTAGAFADLGQGLTAEEMRSQTEELMAIEAFSRIAIALEEQGIDLNDSESPGRKILGIMIEVEDERDAEIFRMAKALAEKEGFVPVQDLLDQYERLHGEKIENPLTSLGNPPIIP